MAASAARVHAQPLLVSTMSRALVSRGAAPLQVALGDELVDELCRGLPGHVQVLGQLGDGGAARGEPGEGEPVRRADVIKTARPDAGRDPVDQGAAGRQQAERQRLGIVVLHRPSLTD